MPRRSLSSFPPFLFESPDALAASRLSKPRNRLFGEERDYVFLGPAATRADSLEAAGLIVVRWHNDLADGASDLNFDVPFRDLSSRDNGSPRRRTHRPKWSRERKTRPAALSLLSVSWRNDDDRGPVSLSLSSLFVARGFRPISVMGVENEFITAVQLGLRRYDICIGFLTLTVRTNLLKLRSDTFFEKKSILYAI